jgi:2-oxoisovalerate dehydrogenase E1 component
LQSIEVECLFGSRKKYRFHKNLLTLSGVADMATYKNLKPSVPWQVLSASDKDWDSMDIKTLLRINTRLHMIRACDNKILELDRDGLTHGPMHTSVGHEGASVASIDCLNPSDQVLGTYRMHHHFLTKSMGYVDPGFIDLREDAITDDMKTLYRRFFAEYFGMEQGFCKGRGGSHIRWAEAGVHSTNAIIGSQVPMAVGSAWAQKQKGKQEVTMCFIGDGGMHIGAVHEGLNLAALYNLPMCLFIENNGYAVSTTLDEQTKEQRLTSRGIAYGIPSIEVDGMDPVAVRLATEEAVAHMRAGKGPYLIQANVYRFHHHSGGAPGSVFGYRDREEEQQARENDPLLKMEKHLTAQGILSEEDFQSLREQCRELMNETVDALTETVDGKRAFKASLEADPADLHKGILGDLSEMEGLRYEELENYQGEIKQVKFIDSVSKVMVNAMGKDERIFCIGEDIQHLNGGTKGATRGILEAFPDRIVGTPIAEEGFVGLGLGAAMEGTYRPVVELMYPDFVWVSADQLFNQIAKSRHIFGGDVKIPYVLRTAIAMGTGYGSQHTMDPAGIVAQFPGWRIVAPSTPFDYVGLMNSALQCEDPVLVLEHAGLFKSTGPGAPDDLNYYIPFGSAKVTRPGSEMTVLTYLGMIDLAIRASDELDIDAEVVDLRTLDIANLDWDTIGESIRKTNNVLIVEEGSKTCSYGSLLADEVQKRFIDYLDQPVQRVHGLDASPVTSYKLEYASYATIENVREGFERVMREKGKPLSLVS